MASSPPRFTLVVETGAGSPSEKAFVAGKEAAPFSVGTAGMWRVSGAGIADVHGFLYFDGETVFVQSAGTRFVVTVDGKPVGTEWSPLQAPCRIQMGGVVLRLDEALDDEGQTVAMDHPPQRVVPSNPAPVSAPSARPFKPGEFSAAPDDGATRVQDIATGSRNIGRPSNPMMRSGSPMMPIASQPPAPGTTDQTAHTQTASGQSALADAIARARAAFNAMSMPMKLSTAAIPLLLMLVLMMPSGSPPPKTKRVADGGGLRDASSAAMTDAGSTAPLPNAASTATLADDDPDGGIIELTDPDSGAIVRMPRGKKTDERKAIDAAFTGKFTEAAELYEQLARENPNRPAYAEAAKIMRAKAAGK